jgi:hypothetical protein
MYFDSPTLRPLDSPRSRYRGAEYLASCISACIVACIIKTSLDKAVALYSRADSAAADMEWPDNCLFSLVKEPLTSLVCPVLMLVCAQKWTLSLSRHLW